MVVEAVEKLRRLFLDLVYFLRFRELIGDGDLVVMRFAHQQVGRHGLIVPWRRMLAHVDQARLRPIQES
jgi:hypothetical protein